MSSRPLRTNAGIPTIASNSRWMLGRTSWAVAFRGPRADATQPQFPIRAAFYYAWYPEQWWAGTFFPYSFYRPTLDYYSDADARAPQRGEVAADAEGVKAQRMRIHHLRGDTALAYEADVVLILNDKRRAVARHHVVYQPNVAEGFHNWVVFSLEKNRGGVDGVDFELRKRFAHACFDPAGGFLSEQLVDGRLYLT